MLSDRFWYRRIWLRGHWHWTGLGSWMPLTLIWYCPIMNMYFIDFVESLRAYSFSRFHLVSMFYDLYFVSALFFICYSTFYNSSYEIDYTFSRIKFKRMYTSSNYFSNFLFYKKEGIYCFKNHISPWRSREASCWNQKWKCLWYKSMKGMWSFQSTKVRRNQAVIQEIFWSSDILYSESFVACFIF